MVRDTAFTRGCNAAFQMCVFAPAHYWQLRNIPFPWSSTTALRSVQCRQKLVSRFRAATLQVPKRSHPLLCSPHSDVSWCHARDVSLTLSVQVTLALLLIRALKPLCCPVFKPELTT